MLSAVFPDIDEVKLPLVAMMHERGPACFDFAYYRSLNTDLGQLATDDQLWGHFLHFGQFERRPFRWAHFPLLQTLEQKKRTCKATLHIVSLR